jgi:hypothetical protein
MDAEASRSPCHRGSWCRLRTGLGGRLHTEASFFAGELGHLPLQPEGPECSCGDRGCLEALASERTVLQFLRDKRSETAGRCTRLCVGAGRKDSSGYRRSRDLCRHGTRSWSQAGHAEQPAQSEKVILGEVIAYPLFRAELESSRRRYSFSTAADDCDLIVDPVDDHLWERERPAWQSSIWSARHGSDHSDRVPRSAGQHDDRFPEPTTGSEA